MLRFLDLHVRCWYFLQTVFRNPQATKAYAIPFPDRLNVPAAEMRVTQDALVTIDMEVPSCHVAVHRWQANTPDGKGNPFYFQHGRLGAAPSNAGLVRMFRGISDPDEDTRYPRVVTLTAPGVRLGTVVAITPDGRYLLTGECYAIELFFHVVLSFTEYLLLSSSRLFEVVPFCFHLENLNNNNSYTLFM
jgi:hypothetical protein